MRFRRRRGGDGDVLIDPRPTAPVPTATTDPSAEAVRPTHAGRYFDAIDVLNRANRRVRDVGVETELRRIRHLAGIALIENPPSDALFPSPSDAVPSVEPQSGLPEITPDQLTSELLRGAILRHGALLVRGLIPTAAAERMAVDIDRSFELRASLEPGDTDGDGYYDELKPEAPFLISERRWIEIGGGVLAVDSPRILFDMMEAFERAGLREVIGGYLGERPAISAQKCTLRKATPDVPGAWHQDGRFLGDVRSLNVWLALSHCGDVAPSLDIVPRRFNDLVPTETEGTYLDYQVSQAIAEEVAGAVGIVRPIFEPGDAVLFDELFLHQTGSDPSMPNARYSIESWFFGPSAYPMKYAPLAF